MRESHIVTPAEIAFGRKLNKVYTILLGAGVDGISKVELSRRTQRMLSGTRERDDIMADLDEAGQVAVRRVGNHVGGRPKIHYWADKFAPPEGVSLDVGEWGRDQGWGVISNGTSGFGE